MFEKFSMISVEIDNTPDSDWNDRLKNSKFGSIYQTIEYGHYVKERIKSVPLFLRFYSDGELVGQLLAFQSFRGKGKLSKHFGRGIVYSTISKISSLLPKYVYWTFGPVVFYNELQSEISESLGNVLNSWNTKFSGSTHPLTDNFNFDKRFGFQKNELGTFLIDLKQDLQQILDNADKNSVKKNIKRAQERGVTITEISSKDDLMVYYGLLDAHRKSNSLISYSVDDVKGYEIIKQIGQKGFLAWYDKMPISGIVISSFNNYINEWGIARSQIDSEKKLYSLDLLRWKIIEWGKTNNCNYYDLTGVKLSNRTEKEDSLYRNKEKWGGKLVIYSSFSN